MRAWVFEKQGELSKVLQLCQDWPDPTLDRKNSVIVSTKCVSLNPVTWKIIASFPKESLKLPAVPELDISGIVESSNTDEFQPGDLVFGWNTVATVLETGHGTLAEKVLVPAVDLVKKPANVDWQQSSSTVASLTAYQMIKTVKLKAGERVFVNGASGGVGTFAVQMAKACGAFVVASYSDRTKEAVKKLGPDEMVNYQESPLTDQLARRYPGGTKFAFDVILDTVGISALYEKSNAYMRANGRLANIGPNTASNTSWFGYSSRLLGALQPLASPRATYFAVNVDSSKQGLQAVADLFASGKITTVVSGVFPFEEAVEALELQKAGRVIGKLVINVG